MDTNITSKEEFFARYELREVTKEFENPVYDGRHKGDFYAKKTIPVGYRFLYDTKWEECKTWGGSTVPRNAASELIANSQSFLPKTFDEFYHTTLAQGLSYHTDVLDKLWANPIFKQSIVVALYEAYTDVEKREAE